MESSKALLVCKYEDREGGELTFAERELTLPVGRGIDAAFTVPSGSGPFPFALILGGTLASDKDGNLIESSGAPVPPRPALRRIAHALASRGWASLRYARWGNLDRWWSTDLEHALSIWNWMLTRPEVNPKRTMIAGESAGAYLACLMAREGVRPGATVFLGALHGSLWDCFVYNYERVKEYAARGPEEEAWCMEHARGALALGHEYPKLFQAAQIGRNPYRWMWRGEMYSFGTKRLQEELLWPPADLFRYVEGRVLALHGEHDLNVPPGDLAGIGTDLKVELPLLRLLPGLDHSFQASPRCPEQRIRERFSLESFRNPFGPELDSELLGFANSL